MWKLNEMYFKLYEIKRRTTFVYVHETNYLEYIKPTRIKNFDLFKKILRFLYFRLR